MHMKVLALVLITAVSGISCKHRVNNFQESSEISTDGVVKAPACPLPTNGTARLPELSSPSGFVALSNRGLSKLGSYSHRARDTIAVPGKPIWIIAKFTYGYLDADLRGEKVAIYLSRDCSSPLEKIGEATTTKPGEHAPVDGIIDDGGRIFVELSSLGINRLPVGRHRILLVVPGDNSSTEMFIDVVNPDTPFVVTEIDGTLTESDYASATEVYEQPPQVYPGAAEALNALYGKGYHIFYLSSRAEWFTHRTRSWLTNNHFPPGTLHTTTSVIGARGAASTRFKGNELSLLKEKTGVVPAIALGNKESDVKAYAAAGIAPSKSFYYNLGEEPSAGGISHTDYAGLAKTYDALPTSCPIIGPVQSSPAPQQPDGEPQGQSEMIQLK